MIEALGATHQRVRDLRRLVQKRSLRWSEGVCVLEGPDLISAALASHASLEALYVDEHVGDEPAAQQLVREAQAQGVAVYALSTGVIEKIADAKTPQPVLATHRFRARTLADLSTKGLTLVCHELRDPGNAGTIIRSADAAGATSVIFTGDSVDPFNPKTLRATAGSIFHVPVAVLGLDEVLSHFSTAGVTSFATVVRGGEDFRAVDLSGDALMIIGSESHGLSDELVSRCHSRISIPMAGRSESLNAGIAAALVSFEALHQREGAK